MGADNAPVIGRPSSYSADLVDEFCRRITTGRSVISVCGDDDMPSHDTVYKWQRLKKEFADSLAHARAERGEAFSVRICELGEQVVTDKKVDPARVRVAIDAIDKAARIMQPRKIELTGAGGGPIKMQAFDAAKLAQLSAEELDVLERAHRILGIASGDSSGEGEASGAEDA